MSGLVLRPHNNARRWKQQNYLSDEFIGENVKSETTLKSGNLKNTPLSCSHLKGEIAKVHYNCYDLWRAWEAALRSVYSRKSSRRSAPVGSNLLMSNVHFYKPLHHCMHTDVPPKNTCLNAEQKVRRQCHFCIFCSDCFRVNKDLFWLLKTNTLSEQQSCQPPLD